MGARQEDHHHKENPWRVRVDDARGRPCGAGVLLDDRHVLTCAHVVRDAGAEPGGAARRLRVSGVACGVDWSRDARADPKAWVHEAGTFRGDVALLELDTPADCGTRTKLWRAPISGGRVRVYGFPRVEPYVCVPAEAELGGSGGRVGEWGLLNRVHLGSQWIERGYSGAGVVALGGEFDGRVIGIVIADRVDGDSRDAWMLPTETVHAYLGRRMEPYVDGDPTSNLGAFDKSQAGDLLDDARRLALTRELTRLLDGGPPGTIVVGVDGGTGSGASWLVRLVRITDPAARHRISDAELSGAPGDTVLGLGAIDAAYDASGATVAEVRDYLVRRFALAGGDTREVVRQLLRRRPPACLVVGSVDRAAEPEALVRDLLGPLAARARSRGLHLVLGFEGRPLDGVTYEVFLDPEPLLNGAAAGRAVTAAAVEEAIGRLATAEEESNRLHLESGLKFFAPPRLPPFAAPRLRVLLAVARAGGPGPELAALHTAAGEARAKSEEFASELRRMTAAHEDLRKRLEAYRARAVRYFGAEDLPLGERYAAALHALLTAPIDLAKARTLVRRYVDEVNRRTGETDEGA